MAIIYVAIKRLWNVLGLLLWCPELNSGENDANSNMKMFDIIRSSWTKERPKKQREAGKAQLSLQSFLTKSWLHLIHPWCFSSLFFPFCARLPTLLLLPGFLCTPVSASLHSLCSQKGVANHRRRGGHRTQALPWHPLAESLLWYVLISGTHCGTFWHRSARTETANMHRPEQRIRIQGDRGYTVQRLRGRTNGHKCTYSWFQQGEIANVRTISVQNNAAESDLPGAKMHLDKSCLSLQQQTAICNAPSITKPGSVSKLCVSPSRYLSRTVSVSKIDHRRSGHTGTVDCFTIMFSRFNWLWLDKAKEGTCLYTVMTW